MGSADSRASTVRRGAYGRVLGRAAIAVVIGTVVGVGHATPAEGTAPAEGHAARVDTHGQPLSVRAGPGHGYRALGTLPDGARVEIMCQTNGTTESGTFGTGKLWDKLKSGGYVADVYIATGSDGRVAPDCGSTGPTSGRRPVTALSMSAQGLTLLKRFEGFRGEAYEDSNGHCTIGYGHLLHRGPCTQHDKGHRLSESLASDLLRRDVRKFENGVKNALGNTPLYQREFDALTSFAFNIGAGGFRGSLVREDLVRTNPNYSAVPGHLLNWTDHGDCGLTKRRLTEGRLFRTGNYAQITHC